MVKILPRIAMIFSMAGLCIGLYCVKQQLCRIAVSACVRPSVERGGLELSRRHVDFQHERRRTCSSHL